MLGDIERNPQGRAGTAQMVAHDKDIEGVKLHSVMVVLPAAQRVDGYIVPTASGTFRREMQAAGVCKASSVLAGALPRLSPPGTSAVSAA